MTKRVKVLYVVVMAGAYLLLRALLPLPPHLEALAAVYWLGIVARRLA